MFAPAEAAAQLGADTAILHIGGAEAAAATAACAVACDRAAARALRPRAEVMM